MAGTIIVMKEEMLKPQLASSATSDRIASGLLTRSNKSAGVGDGFAAPGYGHLCQLLADRYRSVHTPYSTYSVPGWDWLIARSGELGIDRTAARPPSLFLLRSGDT